MLEDIDKVLKLLEALSDLGIKFKVKEGDTIILLGLEPKIIKLLHAVLESQPDENEQTDEGYRLWWD